ncbi:MAG: hypothetical protein GXP14_16290 [Gammaproteobacteria bacterium]|nr:hypothetical protein [Gammaproteobacteria bacterium]
MRRKTEIMRPSRGKPNLELAAELMVPLILEAFLKQKEEPASTSNDKKPSIVTQENTGS